VGSDAYGPEDDNEKPSPDSADEDAEDSDWARNSEDDWQQVDDSEEESGADGDDDDWDLPPIPDADDVLREYMENYHHAESSGIIDVAFEGKEEEATLPMDEHARDDDVDSAIQEFHAVDFQENSKEGDGGGPKEVLPIEPSTGGVPVHDGEPFTPQNVRNSAATGDVRRLEAYLRAKPDWVNDPDGNRWTCLHLAARAGHVEAVRVLLEYRADRSLQTAAGDTPLHIAFQRLGSDHAVTIMLQSIEYPEERGTSDLRDEL
jgi:Ankyrin repeats (many copies)